MPQLLPDLLLAEFAREAPKTRDVLAAVTADSMAFKPAESLQSIGWNANHLLDILNWSEGILTAPEFDFAPPDGPAVVPSSLNDPAKIVQLYDQAISRTRSALAATSDAQLAEAWSLKMHGQILFTMPKGECIRTWVFNHTVHHRGILSVYLRMYGISLTSVFGS